MVHIGQEILFSVAPARAQRHRTSRVIPKTPDATLRRRSQHTLPNRQCHYRRGIPDIFAQHQYSIRHRIVRPAGPGCTPRCSLLQQSVFQYSLILSLIPW